VADQRSWLTGPHRGRTCPPPLAASTLTRIVAPNLQRKTRRRRSILSVHANGAKRVTITSPHLHGFVHCQGIMRIRVPFGLSASRQGRTQWDHECKATLHTCSCLITRIRKSPVAYTVGTKSRPHRPWEVFASNAAGISSQYCRQKRETPFSAGGAGDGDVIDGVSPPPEHTL
jgi:hypothetical protein